MTVISSPTLKVSSSDEPVKSCNARTSFRSCWEGSFMIWFGVLGDPLGKSLAFDMGDFREKERELGGRGELVLIVSGPSSSSFVRVAKLSLSFFPFPVTELMALDAQPATLILLLALSALGVSGAPAVPLLSARFRVALLSERLRDAREVGREIALFPASDFRRDVVGDEWSSSESL